MRLWTPSHDTVTQIAAVNGGSPAMIAAGAFGNAMTFDGLRQQLSARLPSTSITSMTIECRFLLTSAAVAGSLLHVGDGLTGFGFGIGAGDLDTPGDRLVGIFENVRWIDSGDACGPFVAHHAALCLSATSKPTLWLNGVNVYTDAGANPIAPTAKSRVTVGGYMAGAGLSVERYLAAIIDEVRISNVVRYAAPFAPAAAPFVADANTLLLLHMDEIKRGVPLVFEISYGTDAWDTPAYDDESDRWISGESERGRQHELQQFDAGKSKAVLHNADRALDPTNSASAHAGDLTAGVRHRLRAVAGATSFPISHTWSERFTPEWPVEPLPPRTVLTGVDSFKALRKKAIITDEWAAQLYAAHAVTAHYRFGEPAGTDVRDSGPNAHHASIVPSDAQRTPVTGSEGALLTELNGGLLLPRPLTTVIPNSDAVLIPPAVGALGAGALTVGMLVKYGTSLASVFPRLDWRHTNNFVPAAQWILSPLGEGLYHYSEGVAFLIGDFPNEISMLDGRWHLTVWTREADGVTNKLTVDGVDVATYVAAAAADFSAGGAESLRLFGAGDPDANSEAARVDELFIIHGWSMPLATQRALYDTARGKWGSQRSGERVDTALDTVGWPAADRQIDTGQAQLQAAAESLATTKVLDHLQAVEKTEAGMLFQNADGEIVFLDRHKFLAAPYTVSRLTFGDAGDGVEIPYDPAPAMWEGDDDVYSEAISTRIGGQPQRAFDAAADDLTRGGTMDRQGLLYDADAQSLDLSNWNVSQYKTPRIRIGVVRIHAGVLDPAFWPDLWRLEIGDRVTVNRRPVPKTSPLASYAQMVESIKHEFTEDRDWWMELALGPVDLNAYWILGTSQLGIDTRLAF